MKKMKLVFTVFALLALSAFALEEKQMEFKKVKNDGLSGVVDKKTNETVIPFEYKQIKKPVNSVFKVKTKDNKWNLVTIGNEPVLEGEFDKVKLSKTRYRGIYNKHNHTIQITSPDFNSKEILDKIYEQNNKISKIKFYDYPSEAVLVLQQKDKFGFLAIQNDKLIYIPPIYHEIYVPDNSTSIFNIMGISLSDIENIRVYDGYYWFGFDKNGKIKSQASVLGRMATLYIDENVEIKNDSVIFNFKSKSDLFKNLALTRFPKGENFGIGQILSYPKNRIEITDDALKIYENKKIYSIDRQKYDDFYFQDSNTVIFNVKNISFSNPDRIFAKKNGRWGIIDKNENIIADFQYDDILGLNAKENVKLTKKGQHYDFDYKNIIFPKNNIFLVKKNNLYNVINSNGKILVSLGEIIDKEKLKASQNKKISKKTIKKLEEFEIAKLNNEDLAKTTTEPLMFKAYSTVIPVLPSFVLFIPETKIDRKIFKKAL